MKTVAVTVNDLEGLHMRPCMVLVDIASLFGSELVIMSELNGVSIDAKSITQTTMMSCTCGTKVKIFGNGPDEELAVEVLSVFLQRVDMTRFYSDKELDRMIRQKAVQEILKYLKDYPEPENEDFFNGA